MEQDDLWSDFESNMRTLLTTGIIESWKSKSDTHSDLKTSYPNLFSAQKPLVYLKDMGVEGTLHALVPLDHVPAKIPQIDYQGFVNLVVRKVTSQSFSAISNSDETGNKNKGRVKVKFGPRKGQKNLRTVTASSEGGRRWNG